MLAKVRQPAGATLLAMRWYRRPYLVYGGLATVSAILAILLSFTDFAAQIDNDLGDYLFRLHPATAQDSRAVVLAIDEDTLQATGGLRNLRRTLTQVWPALRAAHPAAVVVDLTLTDAQDDAEDAALAAEFTLTPKLVLGSEMTPDALRWRDPIERFARSAAAIGHVHAQPQDLDSVTREVVLERVSGRRRLWALSLEAYRVYSSSAEIESSPTDIVVGQRTIRSRWDAGRPMRIRFREPGQIPRVSLQALLKDPAAAAALTGRVVFVGVTAQSAARDRLLTPLSFGVPLAGVEIHAQAFETILHGDYLLDAPAWWGPGLALLFSAVAALLFWLVPGGWAYALAVLSLSVAHLLPDLLFRQGVVLAPFAPVTAAWLSSLACFSYQFFVVRRRLGNQRNRSRPVSAGHPLRAHEMRTPLTAIQGSSELITRYNLTEHKRKQLGQMINSESKRLAKMITTFLDVEKLAAGQLQLNRTEISVAELAATSLDRALPLAENKHIALESRDLSGFTLSGDRELMEYALYNLITNAIKYSAEGTAVTVHAEHRGAQLELSVRDHGMGMNEKEVKSLFRKFYRTESAVKSGEAGTGLGLSIVQQIVTHHSGRVQVTSQPGKGSSFTIVVPAPDGTLRI